MEMNKHVEIALLTWYPKDHPFHMDLEPSLMGLAGECGELIDLHKKAKFKPGFELTREMELDELGDIWYYFRIVAYQNFDNIHDILIPYQSSRELTSYWYASFNNDCASMLYYFLQAKGRPDYGDIRHLVTILHNRIIQLNCTLDELTELNWQKLSKREDEMRGYGFKHA